MPRGFVAGGAETVVLRFSVVDREGCREKKALRTLGRLLWALGLGMGMLMVSDWERRV